MSSTPASDPHSIAELLARELAALLGEWLAAVVLTGSVAANEHDGASDVDLIAVLRAPAVDARSIVELRALYDRVADANPTWTDRIEVVHVDDAALAGFRSGRHHMAVISPGEPLHVVPCTDEWLVNWHLAREHGVQLFGAADAVAWPATTHDEYVAAVVAHAESFARRADSISSARYLAYGVITCVRALATVSTGAPASKRGAVERVNDLLPEWAPLVARAYEVRAESGTADIDVADCRACIIDAASRAGVALTER